MKRQMRTLTGRRMVALVAGIATVAVQAMAATFVWDGGGADRYWTTAANWVGDVAPAPADDLNVQLQSTTARYNPIVDVNEPWTLNQLSISNYQYSVSGNTLRFAGEAPRLIIGPGSHGFFFRIPSNWPGI